MTKDTKPAARRIYSVVDAKGDMHLVKASSPAQAVAHIYAPYVNVAKQDELVSLSAQGVKVEEA